MMPTPIFDSQAAEIGGLASVHQLIAIFPFMEYLEGGGLAAYGTDLVALLHRAGTYVDRILRGAKPADLPIEQPTKFELVINMKAAKALGPTIPPTMLLRADRVLD